MEKNINENKIKEQLYSRQIASIGIESMKKLSELKILVIGMKGLGIEISKNIILQGPSKVSIFDNTISSTNDLCCNYYLNEEDIGKKRRDESIYLKLQELNKYVKVECLLQYNSIEEMIDLIEQYNIIVITEIIIKENLIKLNEKCREKKVKFIFCVNLGLTGYIFSDFGNNHLILNKFNKEEKTFIIKSITNDINGLVEIEHLKEGIGNVKSVVFNNVKGMIELNDKAPISIKKRDNYSFYIGDTSKLQKYTGGGILKEKQIPIKMEYKGISERLISPYDKKGYILSFISDEDDNEGRISTELLYMILVQIINNYRNINDSSEINEKFLEDYYNKIIGKIKEDIKKKKDENWIKKIGNINENIVKKICINSINEIPCLTSFLGGIVSQEIIKCIGIFFPINQWAIFDFNDNNYISDSLLNNENNISRYNNLYNIFGKEKILHLQNKKIFLIGTGSLGCELLKQFGLLGIKNVTAIDDDLIELSNLNRQFLFKEKDLGKKKAEIACNSILKMNPELKNYIGIPKKLEKETESIFNYNFWSEYDVIFCALDSLEGRKYIDEKCVLYEKPWINGGMNSLKGKTEIFVPFKTCCLNDINFGEKKEKDDEPSCTLRYFPTKFDECILWAKNIFFQYFIFYISDLETIFNNKNYGEILKNKFDITDKTQIIKLNVLYYYLKVYKSKKIEDLVLFGNIIFNYYFIKEIQELLIEYPIYLKKEDGEFFWNNKLIPNPINLNDNINSNLYKQFIINFIKILKVIFNIDIKIRNENEIEKYLSNINNNSNLYEFNNEIIDKIMEIKTKINKIEIKKIEFEKDDIDNGHIDFIHSCACLRANNFKIPLSDKYKTFKIAGNIAPSTIAINSTIGGLMALEFIDLFCNETKIKKYTIDLDIDSGIYIEEKPSKVYYKKDYYDSFIECKFKAIPNIFSIWNKIEIKGSKTLKEFIDYIKNEYNVEVTLINANDIVIYEKKIMKEFEKIILLKKGLKSEEYSFDKKIEEIYLEKKNKKNNNEHFIFLKISGNIEDSRALMPLFKYSYKI